MSARTLAAVKGKSSAGFGRPLVFTLSGAADPEDGIAGGIVVVALRLRHAGRQVARDVLLGAWPGDPRHIERLLGESSN
ncbi:hypothetical protein AB0H43_36725 [Hamadaea sp. NPDC050747]|uniref:hypothetical protein n=1 Tax=Hamadaea sp. NPDC050747 TaxID=3155789 RepID=UPI0034006C02